MAKNSQNTNRETPVSVPAPAAAANGADHAENPATAAENQQKTTVSMPDLALMSAVTVVTEVLARSRPWTVAESIIKNAAALDYGKAKAGAAQSAAYEIREYAKLAESFMLAGDYRALVDAARAVFVRCRELAKPYFPPTLADRMRPLYRTLNELGWSSREVDMLTNLLRNRKDEFVTECGKAEVRTNLGIITREQVRESGMQSYDNREVYMRSFSQIGDGPEGPLAHRRSE